MAGKYASLASRFWPIGSHVGRVAVQKRIFVKRVAIRLCCRRKLDKTPLLQILTKLVQQTDVINEDLAPMGTLRVHNADEDSFTLVLLEPFATFLREGIGVFVVGYVADDLAS